MNNAATRAADFIGGMDANTGMSRKVGLLYADGKPKPGLSSATSNDDGLLFEKPYSNDWISSGNEADPASGVVITLATTANEKKAFDHLAGTGAVKTLHGISSVSAGLLDQSILVGEGQSGGTLLPLMSPLAVTTGAGADTLVLRMAEDEYKGDAQFTVSMDGTQLGGTFTTTALQAQGVTQDFIFNGNWSEGSHTVTVNFLNDAWDGTASTDRNLYVDDIIYNGASTGQAAALYSQGPVNFNISDFTALRASDVVQAWGVDTALTFNNSYGNTSLVINELNYLGIDHVRELMGGTDDYAQNIYRQLAADGAKFDFLVSTGGAQDLASTMTRLDLIAQTNPGAIVSVEGSNEINLWPITYDGLTGMAAGVAWQQALYTAVKSDPNLAGIPVINLTLGGGTPEQYQALGNLSAFADYGNVHLYPGDPNSTSAPASYIIGPNSYVQYSNQDTPGLPMIMTEFGYYTTPDNQGGVTEAVQAKYELDALFDSMKAGLSQVYLYELMNGDPTDPYGLFYSDGTPKEIAVGLHNLTAILKDTGANAGSFTPGSLNVSFSNMPATGNSLVMEKSNGTFDIAVWNEPDIWDVNNVREIAAPTSTVTVNLGAAFGSVKVYDPLTGTSAVQSLSNVGQLQLGLTDHPLIIEVGSATTPQPDIPNLSTPPSETTTVYGTVAVTGVIVSDPIAAQTGSMISVDLSDSQGTLDVNGALYGPGTTAHISGSVDAVNAALGTLIYEAGIVPTLDTIVVSVRNSAGNTAEGSIPITVGNLEIDVPSWQSKVTLDQWNTILVASGRPHTVYVNGSYDTLVLSGGRQTIYERGDHNVFVIPQASQGYDDIYGANLAQDDSFNFGNALAASNWDGQTADLSSYLHLRYASGNTVVSISETAGGSASRVLVVEGQRLSMSQLLAHSQLT